MGKAGIFHDPFPAAKIEDETGVVPDPQVSFYRTFREGFGKPFAHHPWMSWIPHSNGMHVRRSSADVNDDQVAQTFFRSRSLRYQLRRPQDSRRRRHEDPFYKFFRFGQAFGLDDSSDEDFPDHRAGRLDIQYVDFRHDVIGDESGLSPSGENRAHLICHHFVPGYNNRTADAALGELPGIFENYLGIAAVSSTGQEQDVWRQLLELLTLAG